MKFLKKLYCISIVILAAFCSVAFDSFAVSDNEAALEKFFSYDEKLLCISHRGDTAFYPENSLEAVESALKKGADFVSVNLEKTSDGVFYLCEGESLGNVCNATYERLSDATADEADEYFLYDTFGQLTKHKMTSLAELLEKTDSEDGLIFDIKSEYKDEVYDVLKENGALSRAILRIEESAGKLSDWAEKKDEKVYVIGKYTGNIIFSTISHINSLTEAQMPAVQYESKNFFNVCFGEFFTNRYLTNKNARAVTATYSLDLCGQRGDSADAWNELISKGYSVIETNNIESFAAYRNEAERLGEEISLLLDRSSEVESEKYSLISFDNLKKAETECRRLLSASVFSLSEAQKAYSQLNEALKEMKISAGEVDTRGALNVTAGKIIAAVLVGVVLLSGQIYVYKMRRSNKEKNVK